MCKRESVIRFELSNEKNSCLNEFFPDRRSGNNFFAFKSSKNSQKSGIYRVNYLNESKKAVIKLVMCEKNATFAY